MSINLSETSRAARMKAFVEDLQQRLCRALEDEDGGAAFRFDEWTRAEGGGGTAGVIEEGELFEKGGVNTSAVWGPLPERMAGALGVEEAPFFATGLSLVLHPRSPYVPTFHANIRYFALGTDRDDPQDEWFGGGADLTPYYPFLEDAQHFHHVLKGVCDAHPGAADYQTFKEECDDYFYLPHRQEARGVGGLFYDYVRAAPEDAFAFSSALGDALADDAYLPIVRRRREQSYGRRERHFQAVRRGRYVEFNLVYDRGTKFGLETGGRTESILMSLPPKVQWRYDYTPEPGTPEARAQWFLQPRDWLALSDGDGPPVEGRLEA